eukprot:22639-Rhodomonas_salina.1
MAPRPLRKTDCQWSRARSRLSRRRPDTMRHHSAEVAPSPAKNSPTFPTLRERGFRTTSAPVQFAASETPSNVCVSKFWQQHSCVRPQGKCAGPRKAWRV